MHKNRYKNDKSLICISGFHFNGVVKYSSSSQQLETKSSYYSMNRGEKHVLFAQRVGTKNRSYPFEKQEAKMVEKELTNEHVISRDKLTIQGKTIIVILQQESKTKNSKIPNLLIAFKDF